MPRSAGWSFLTSSAWWCFNPRASSVRRCPGGRPMTERICRMRSNPVPAGGSTGSRPLFRLRYFRVGGFLAMRGRLLARLVGDALHLDPALPRHAARRDETLQAVERGAHHVVRIGGPQALGEDVAHARALEHRAHAPARDDARPGGRGLHEYAPGAVIARDLVRNGAARERDLHHAAPRCLQGLADRLAHLVRLARRHAHWGRGGPPPPPAAPPTPPPPPPPPPPRPRRRRPPPRAARRARRSPAQ